MAVGLKRLNLKKGVRGGTYFMTSLVCVHLNLRSIAIIYE
jgi:hypothetical protein